MRKCSLKKKIAFLLALSMVCSFPQSISAEAVLSNIGKSQVNSAAVPLENVNQMEFSTDMTEDNAGSLQAENITLSTNTGRVDVSIDTELAFVNPVDFEVTLSHDGHTQKGNITLSKTSKENGENKVSFNNLENGEYVLKVTAPGFTADVQTIYVNNGMYSVKLTAGFLHGYTYEKNTRHPGVLMTGDINNDGKVDDTDKNILIDTIDNKTNLINSEYYTDLNYDGKTNLMDLTFFSKSYQEYKETTAQIEEFVSPANIKIAVPEDMTVTSGSLEEMLNGGETVQIAPADTNAEISDNNPVVLGFDFTDDENGASTMDGLVFETGNTPVSSAKIDITYVENGEEHTIELETKKDVDFLLKESNIIPEIDAYGNIYINLKGQVAVKKVTLIITGLQKQNDGDNNCLAEISKVEFINGMEKRIPEPEMDIPENLTVVADSEKFTLKWDSCVNVTGYQVKIEQGEKVETVKTTSDSIEILTFQGKEIENYTTYTVSVQSVNDKWKSDYSNTIEVTPKPTKRPDKPDNVSASGNYKSVSVNWKKMKDTLSYNIYYKVRNSDEEYTKISDIKENKYTISGLNDLIEYEIYVTGVNELGESPESIHCSARTTDVNPAEVPRFHMINRDEKGIPGSTHIISVTRNGGSMIDSTADEESNNTAWGAVDGDARSYYSKNTWDDGGFNNIGSNGLTYTFDDSYKMDTIAMLATNGMQFSYVKVRWWEADGTNKTVSASCQQLRDSQGRIYHVIKLPYAVTTNKIQIGLARYLSGAAYNLITVSETYFYHYDNLRDEIMDLYADDLHTVLKDSVTQQTIDDLRVKVNTPDEFGEENTNKTALLRELETAEKILNDESLNSAVEIHNGITTKDTGRGFSGLNAWQPLGVSAAAGETITIYVGHNTKSTGDTTDLRMIATQYHSESGGVVLSGANLKVGANEITLPRTNSSIGAESGGALYVQYQGNNSKDRYSVRVSGGAEVPILDLYKITDENERKERAVAFVEKLDKYSAEMESLHNELHSSSGNENVNYNYDSKNCILGASDILLDTMMISLPAQQMLAGCGNGSSEERAETMLKSMEAMEDMMYLFYQHKGLNASAPAELNRIPKGHLNIRYQRMFSGAFMYASGNHIGIEWNEAKGIMNAVPIVSDENGKYISGNYFGWGISHEIGHCINQSTYAVAEITNNYFAQLAQAKDTNTGMRFNYDNIYSKVTSGTKGDCSNIATQLGMYWQLHLAYDNGLNYKTYPVYNEQIENLFYARVDTYSRNANAAPAPNGVKLTLGNNTDQNLMRLACAAAEKNVIEFFERWGKEPDPTTLAYAEQFEKETRAIFYANDDSRIYALNGKGSVLSTDGSVSVIENVSVEISKTPNQVELVFTSSNIPEDDILGYEVIRCTISGGKTEETPVGFATGSKFTDTVTTMNNRAVFYKVILIDKYLNRSAPFVTKAVKIEHDGSMNKTNWTISTTGLTAESVVHDATDEMPCEQTENNPAELAIDHDLNTVYTPQVNNGKAEIIIDFNQTLTTTGMKYTVGDGASVGDYEVYVMSDNEWILTAEGTFNGSKTVYFANDDDKYISTYDADAVKLVLLNQENKTVSIAELDVLGVTGDNVDFRRVNETSTAVIGTLSTDYQYGEESGNVIPEGSLVFTGAYKGNPAYNVVIVYDENGEIVGGTDSDGALTAQQIILADVPDNGNIANVSDGTWIYWIEPEQIENMKNPEKVRVELYRVNNALTNEGQRLVSDSLFEEMPDLLPDITFGK